jgi:hypothetical protein
MRVYRMIRMSVGKKISLGIGFFLFPVMLLGYFFYSEKTNPDRVHREWKSLASDTSRLRIAH